MRRYNLDGIAGLVAQHVCRRTGGLMGLYHAEQGGIDSDPDVPWAAVCETHGSLVLSTTQRLARATMSYPDWCDECAPLLED